MKTFVSFLFLISLCIVGYSGISAEDIEPKASGIESKVDGEFEGWDGETIVKLVNGQIYEQAEYYYEYHYAYMPDVLVYSSGGRIKMKVEGVKKAVAVRHLK